MEAVQLPVRTAGTAWAGVWTGVAAKRLEIVEISLIDDCCIMQNVAVHFTPVDSL